jgi:CubicO group peptidase (beta-lactamase class C family)
MQRQFKYLIYATLLFISFPAHSQPKASTFKPVIASPESVGMSSSRLKRIDENAAAWINAGKTNGCVVLISRNGKIVYNKAYGFNDPEKKEPMRTDHIFRIASQTKAITSVAVMMLYEEGKFLLDEPVSKYIPEIDGQQVLSTFNKADSSYTTVPAKSAVTIRQLLTHTSGIGYAQIGSEEANAIFAKAGVTAGLGLERGRLLATDMKKLCKLPLLHQPGEKWTYGLNTDLLGYLVEVVSGMSLDRFFRERIFEPLGMNDTYFYLPREKYNRLATLFDEKDGKLEKAPARIEQNGIFITDYPRIEGTYFSGGGGLSSTTLDYAIFLQMMLNDGELNGVRLLSRNTVRMMTMNQIGDVNFGDNKFGLGFGITTEKGSAVLPTPEGVFEWAGAFSTTYWADPKEKLIGIIYRQMWHNSNYDAADKFKVLTYQAIND